MSVLNTLPRSTAVTVETGPSTLAVTVLAIILLGLSAGFFVTYSISVTAGLGVIGDLAYVEAFQGINREVQTPQFAAFFFGAVPVTALAAFLNRGSVAGWLLAAALLVYVLGVSFVTFAFNVPLNNELATFTELTAPVAEQARAAFEDRWNLFNLIRAFTSLGAFTLAAGALATLVKVVR